MAEREVEQRMLPPGFIQILRQEKRELDLPHCFECNHLAYRAMDFVCMKYGALVLQNSSCDDFAGWTEKDRVKPVTYVSEEEIREKFRWGLNDLREAVPN